ncbi:hypothetical protein A6V39_03210 [Candidatus Mycoplasma haematobovis]|uniref:Type I restriction modification DNA specificity domain-containing protein n=1 Tax=Candidatus Mycoplasma haematobovis TaxID=432608 RepID=A0A1A9QDU1_9MOLU|nr:restriction endonuclease subunit S [Candidatus Mycoplasma haematobovis]OAL10418.1 hypothetical protein A6V39_03210 [Candidatus Mycoplasma haematobovis]
MSVWKETTLEKLGTLETGKQTAKKVDVSLFDMGNVPLIDGKEVSESRLYILKCNRHYNKLGLRQSKLFSKNTVCLVRCGSSGDSALLKFDACLSDKIYGFNSFENISDPKFIRYCLTFRETKRKLIALSSSSTAQPVLSFKKLSLIKISVPNFATQKKIGDILSAYDELIENHQKQIEILEKLRTDLYKEWFINLRFPNYEKYEIKDGLPEGWKKIKLKDIATIQKGKKPAGHANPNGEYPFFTAAFETKKSNGFSYDSFSLIIAEGGEFHIKIYNGKFEASDHTYIINFENLDYIFLVCEALDANYINFLNKTIVGTTIKNLPIKQVKELSILLPTKELIKKFNIFCEDIQSKIEKLDAKMRKN